ncbi:hypothetical protein VNI00_014833 [Paramarasmius palmivorus]|uniref:HNH nuclease domain-containing protein n=1 Tax=Paramarasmius palmivorus TaxID=297713 RepID=A0AAW0BTX8_9AGAR
MAMAYDPHRPHPPKPLQYGDSTIQIYIAVAAKPSLDITAPGNRLWSEEPLFTFPKTFLHSLDLPQNNWIPWLRYASYIVTGQPGYLAVAPNEVELLDTLPATSPTDCFAVYYHPTSNLVCTIDPDLGTAISTYVTGPGFREKVIARDRHCVWTDFPEHFCDAAHIIPHNKNLLYINRLLTTRNVNGEPLEDIDDVRNGPLLCRTYYIVSARGTIAFMRTPIPGVINSSDLHYDILMLHYIKQDIYDDTKQIIIPPNYAVDTPGSDSDKPSHVLLDAIYGYHLLHQFGNVEYAKRLFKEATDGYFGPYGPLAQSGIGGKERAKKQKEDEECRQCPDQDQYEDEDEGDECGDSESDIWHPPRNFEDATMQDFLRLLRWSYISGAQNSSSGPSQSPVENARDKVEGWRQGVP